MQDRILAYAVEVKGLVNGRVIGDVYELDYRNHIRDVNRAALPKHTVTAKYEDGTNLTLPHKDYENQRERLYYRHGQVISFRTDTEDAAALRDILKQARDKREGEATPAAFKLRVKNPKPSIKQQIAAGKQQLAAERSAVPKRTAVKSNALEV